MYNRRMDFDHIEDDIPDPRRNRKIKYHRHCLGIQCNKAFVTRNKFVRLCDNCKKNLRYKFDKYTHEALNDL